MFLFQEEGVNITVNSVHPGLIMTNLFKYSGLVVSKFKVLKLSTTLVEFLKGGFLALNQDFFDTEILRWVTCMLWKNVPQVRMIEQKCCIA